MWNTCPNEKSATRSVSSSSTFSGDHQTVSTETMTSSPTATPVAAASNDLEAVSLLRGGGECLHLGRLGGVAVRVFLDHVGLVVDALGVHVPDVVLRPGKVVDGAHRREH